MFPVTSDAEMAGQPGANRIANVAAIGPVGVWELLAKRLQGIPDYVDHFIRVFDDVMGAKDISYTHAGAYDTLEDVVRHHLNPQVALWEYHDLDHCREKPVMPSREDLDASDCAVMDDSDRVQAIADAASGYQPIHMTDSEVKDLVAFLHALTDKGTIDLRSDVPRSVPSGASLAE